MLLGFVSRNRIILFYGLFLALMLFLLKWLELRFIIIDRAFEIYIGSIALIFTWLGIWLALKFSKPKENTVVVEKEIYRRRGSNFKGNERDLSNIGLRNEELQ